MKNAENICQKWDSNPRLENQTATWTQRLRPLGHPDSYTMNSDNIFSHIKIPYIKVQRLKLLCYIPFTFLNIYTKNMFLIYYENNFAHYKVPLQL